MERRSRLANPRPGLHGTPDTDRWLGGRQITAGPRSKMRASSGLAERRVLGCCRPARSCRGRRDTYRRSKDRKLPWVRADECSMDPAQSSYAAVHLDPSNFSSSDLPIFCKEISEARNDRPARQWPPTLSARGVSAGDSHGSDNCRYCVICVRVELVRRRCCQAR